MKEFKDFTDIELDALREFTNMGAAHAATALSKLVDRKIQIKTPQVKIAPVEQIPAKLGGADNPGVGLYFRTSGDLSGSILLFFPQATAHVLVELLTSDMCPKSITEFNEVGRSALMEVGNILTNSYLNALAEMMHMRLLLSVPHYSADFLGAVIDFLLIELAQAADYALLMETVIESAETKFAGSLIVFPDEASLQKIFESVGLS